MQIGIYEVESEIARGGAGVVYRARHGTRGTLVAIKVLLSQHTTPDEVERFRREAEATFRLRHPHVVGVLEFDYHQGHPYLVLEYVEGESFQERIQREGTVVVEDLIRIGEQIADALHYAHAVGLVHRDIKPHNILLEAGTGRAVLTDFGLAQFRNELTKETLTVTGEVVGTPAYMSPEQALGDRERVGPPTDVYALAATLYAGLCGRPPFDGDHAMTVMTQVATDPVPHPLTFNPQANRALADLCMQCLAKQPSERAHTAETLREALRDLLARTTGSGQARYAPPSKAPLLVAFAAAAAVWFTVGLLFGRGSDSPTEAASSGGTSLPSGSRWWEDVPGDGLVPPDATSGEALLAAGLRAAIAGRPAEARAALDDYRLSSKHPLAPGVWWALLQTQEQLGRWEESLASATELARLEPNLSRARWAQARALIELSRPTEALECLANDPASEAIVLRARATLGTPEEEEALAAAGELGPDHPAFDGWRHAVLAFPADSDREALLRARVSRTPRDSGTWLELVELYERRWKASKVRELPPAEAALEGALADALSALPGDPRLEAMQLSLELFRRGNLRLPSDAAAGQALLQRVERLCARDPSRMRAHLFRAALLVEFERNEEAKEAISDGFAPLQLELGLGFSTLATTTQQDGFLDAALETAKPATRLAPLLSGPRVVQLRTNLWRGDIPEASRHLLRLLERDRDALRPSDVGELLLGQGLPAQASAQVMQDGKAQRAADLMLRGILALKAGDHRRARTELERLAPERRDALWQLLLALAEGEVAPGGVVEGLADLRARAIQTTDQYVHAGHVGTAVHRCSELLWLSPTDPELRARRSRLHLLQGLHLQALVDLRELVRAREPNALMLQTFAQAALRLRHPGLALGLAQELERRFPQHRIQCAWIQAQAYSQMGMHELGLVTCERALEGAQPSRWHEHLRGAHGILLERAGRHAEAIPQLQAGLAASGQPWTRIPRPSLLALSLGRSLLAEGRPAEAERWLREVPKGIALEVTEAEQYAGERFRRHYEEVSQTEGTHFAAVTGQLQIALAEGRRQDAIQLADLGVKLVLGGHQPLLEDAQVFDRLTRQLR